MYELGIHYPLPCDVLCCLRRRPLFSGDQWPGEALQLSVFIYVVQIISSYPDTTINGIEEAIEEEKLEILDLTKLFIKN